jgi:hypothetical protein
VADFLITHTQSAFFDLAHGRFGIGKSGTTVDSLDGINGVFSQGYLSWIMGGKPEANAALAWLQAGLQADSSLSLFPGDPHFALSAEVYALAVQALGGAAGSSMAWMTNALMLTNGGIMDSTTEASTPRIQPDLP